MDQQNIESRVIGVFAEQFSVADSAITATTGPEEIEAWDSLNHMSLVAALEAEFQTSFEVEEIMELEDVGATINLIGRKVRKAA